MKDHKDAGSNSGLGYGYDFLDKPKDFQPSGISAFH